MENMFVCILVSGACGCAAPSAERFMLIAESGRVHLHGVVTRDVVHVNSGVREVLLVGEGQCMESLATPSCLCGHLFVNDFGKKNRRKSAAGISVDH